MRKTLDSKVKLSIFMASDPCNFIQARMQYFVQKTFKNAIIACYSLCWDPMRHFRIWAFALWRKQHLSADDFESGMPGVRGVLQWPCDKQDQSQARSKPKIFCWRNWKESLHAVFKSSMIMILRACAIHLAYSYQTNESTRTFWNILRLWTKYEVTQQSIALPLMTLPSPLRQDWSALSIPRFTCTSQCLIWTGFDGTAWDMIFSALKSEKRWLHCTLHISALCLASKSMASTGSTFW